MALNLDTAHHEHKLRTIKYAIIACLSLSVFIAISFNFLLAPARADSINTTDFVMTWKTDNPGSTSNSSITLPMRGDNYSVDWNDDGVIDQSNLSGAVVHDFGSPGTYTIRLSGSHGGTDFGPGKTDDQYKLISVDQWGTSPWLDMDYAFFNAINMSIEASDAPNMGSVQTMERMFSHNNSLNQPLNDWDVSNVTNMERMFFAAQNFNQPLNDWNVSNVTNMQAMFAQADDFNQPLNDWNVSNVIDMGLMFYDADTFNQPLSNWDVSTVTSMGNMFVYAANFNQPLNDWNISNVTSIGSMFDYTSLSIRNYDLILNAWSDLPLKTGVNFSASVGYCRSGDARQYIIDAYEWNITDGGKVDCAVVVSNVNARNGIVAVGPETSSSTIDIYGNHFDEDTTVTVNGEPASIIKRTGAYYLGVVVSTSMINLEQSPQDVDITVTNYDGSTFTLENAVAFQTRPKPIIQNVSFEQENERIMVIDGTNLINSVFDDEYFDADVRSLTTLNNLALPMCVSQAMYEEYQDYANQGFDYYVMARFSTSAPCYYAYDDNYESTISSDQARVWLPSNFDITAPGTVSVNGSNTFTFNAVTDPEDPTDPTDPETPATIPATAYSNGTKPLDQTPVLPKRPTFSGIATPGATIVVTVRSDPVSCSATADSTGNWSCTLPADLVPGAHTAYIQVTNPDGSIQNLGPYAITVAGETISNTTPLAPNTGFMQRLQDYKQVQATHKTQALIVMIVALTAALAATLVTILVVKSRRRVIQFER